MPPRKASARRNKSSSKNATTPVDHHESPAPAVKLETKLADDLKVETVPEILIQEKVSDHNRAEIEGGGFPSESMAKEDVVLANRSVRDVDEARNEDGETVSVVGVVKEDLRSESEDLQESENVDGLEQAEELGKDEDGVFSVDGPQSEKNTEIISAQEEMTAAQVDDFKILDDKNNDVQDSDISKSLCKNDDGPIVNNGDIKGTMEMVSVQESAQAFSTQTSHKNKTALAVKDESMENMDNDEINDTEGDDAGNEGGEHQVHSLIIQDSSPDNKKEKGTEIYVGKLDKNAVEDDLVSVFQQFGELKSTRIVRKPTTNRSKGFGFVRFASVDQANRALSELKDGVEVRGKRVMISASQDNDTLYLGNICKMWKKEQVLQQLKEYGIEHVEVLRIPEDSKIETKNKGFAFLEFSTHSDAVAAFQRLKKPDVFFGRDVSAKVAFAQTPMHSRDEDLSQVNEVHLEGLTKDWNEEKVKGICEKYGEILKINLCPGKRNKRKDFGFVIFNSSESALACVEGINNTAIEGEGKIKASIAKPQQKGRIQKMKEGEHSNKKSQPKSSKMESTLNTQQTKRNKKDSSKNKIKDNTLKPQQKGSLKKDEESSKEAELSKMNADNDPQQRKRKRKAFSEQKSSDRDPGFLKKSKNGVQGQNSQSVSKARSNKRKKSLGNEVNEDRGNRNTQGRKHLKKQKGNMHGMGRDNSWRPKSDTHTRRGHDDYRNSARYIDPYAPKYAASASNAYHLASDPLLPTRPYKEMEPHAGYIEPAFAKHSRSYLGYAHPVARTPHSQHQAVYVEPVSTGQGQSQLYTRYLDRPVMTHSHRGYMETAVAPAVQPYRDYRPSAVVQIARDPYDSGLARGVRHDGRGAGGLAYVGGPPLPASQASDGTNYYQAGGSYGGAYGSHGGYY